MTYDVNQHELENVLRMSPFDRYNYLVAKLAAWRTVWGIADGTQWVLYGDDTGSELVPIWPAQAFAAACCVGEWQQCMPKAIALEAWMERWIPGMLRDGRQVAVFALPDKRGMVVDPAKLAADIREALAQYDED